MKSRTSLSKKMREEIDYAKAKSHICRDRTVIENTKCPLLELSALNEAVTGTIDAENIVFLFLSRTPDTWSQFYT